MSKETADMWELASALYLHGPNIDTLHTVLPNWSKGDIQQTLRKFKNKAIRERAFIDDGRKAIQPPPTKKFKSEPTGGNFRFATTSQSRKSNGLSDMKSNSQSALVCWSKLLSNIQILEGTTDKNIHGIRNSKFAPLKDHSQLLSRVMLYSACFEDHYHGGLPDDTCYSEIYRYLSHLLSGEEPTQLRPKSAAKVLHMLQRLTAMLNTSVFADQIRKLQSIDLSSIQKVQTDGDAAAAGSDSSRKQQESNIALFEDPTAGGGAAGEEGPSISEACQKLDPLDPYFDEKREVVNKRLLRMQEATAASLEPVFGLNPLHLPPSLLVKPLKAFPATYPARTDSLSRRQSSGGT